MFVKFFTEAASAAAVVVIVDVASVCELNKITTFVVVSMSLEDCDESSDIVDLNGLKVDNVDVMTKKKNNVNKIYKHEKEQQMITNIAVSGAVLTVSDAVLIVLRILNSCSHLRNV